jgi:hypothetical protein
VNAEWLSFVADNSGRRAALSRSRYDVERAKRDIAAAEEAVVKEAATPSSVACAHCSWTVEFDEDVPGAFADAWALSDHHMHTSHG